MPLPFLVWGAAAVMGVVGAAGHMSANDKNKEAQKICDDANKIFNTAKNKLEKAQHCAEDGLLTLGSDKKLVMDTSMDLFLSAYNRVKHIKLDYNENDELTNLVIRPEDILDMQKMKEVYNANTSSGGGSAASSALIALAASGSLPIMAGTLSIAGELILAGEFSLGLGLAGTTVTAAMSATPFAAIAAPIFLFTAFSADTKADENLEKAQVLHADAEKKAIEMETKQILCDSITKKSEMFRQLLVKLNEYFSASTELLDQVLCDRFGDNEVAVPREELTDKDLELIAVTRALAGAVKALIAAPMLTKNGDLSNDTQITYETYLDKVPQLQLEAEKVQTYDYDQEYRDMLSERLKDPRYIESFAETAETEQRYNQFTSNPKYYVAMQEYLDSPSLPAPLKVLYSERIDKFIEQQKKIFKKIARPINKWYVCSYIASFIILAMIVLNWGKFAWVGYKGIAFFAVFLLLNVCSTKVNEFDSDIKYAQCHSGITPLLCFIPIIDVLYSTGWNALTWACGKPIILVLFLIGVCSAIYVHRERNSFNRTLGYLTADAAYYEDDLEDVDNETEDDRCVESETSTVVNVSKQENTIIADLTEFEVFKEHASVVNFAYVLKHIVVLVILLVITASWNKYAWWGWKGIAFFVMYCLLACNFAGSELHAYNKYVYGWSWATPVLCIVPAIDLIRNVGWSHLKWFGGKGVVCIMVLLCLGTLSEIFDGRKEYKRSSAYVMKYLVSTGESRYGIKKGFWWLCTLLTRFIAILVVIGSLCACLAPDTFAKVESIKVENKIATATGKVIDTVKNNSKNSIAKPTQKNTKHNR
ncbi:MAG: hypothetical protein Q4E34_00345 [Synergistaceae bacterium]|nr:hypothetical protein [Synergistaceae bacterium]